MLHLRETLIMPSNYYKDVTDSAPDALKESVKSIKQGKSKMIESLSTSKILAALKEAKYDDSLVSKVVAKLKEGGVNVSNQRIYRVPVARINPPGTLNGNHRRYPRELWENVMNNQESSWKGLCGLADHPTDDSDPGSFKNSSIVWLGMDIDTANNIVYGLGSFVGPYGHLAQEIIDAGGRVGFSSSGFGELESDGETVNPDTYQIERLADVVLNPSQSVYGTISDEANLGNIEYSKKQAVHESVENSDSRIQENTMDGKETGVKSALSKVEEKELRRHINNYLKENVEIINPIKQLADLKEIQSLIQEGQLTDLEPEVETKLSEAQKKIEEMVEYGLKMKEAEVSVEAGAPVDTKIEVAADGAVEVKVGDTPVAEVPAVEEPVVDTSVPAAETEVEVPAVDAGVPAETDSEVKADLASEEPVTDEDVDNLIDKAADEAEEESPLTDREEEAIRSYVESFLKADHSAMNPLDLINESNKVLELVKDSKLKDLEESVTKAIEDTQKQLKEDIDSTHQMKLDLQASSVNEINESAKTIMKSGKLLIDQVADYKELCEAITKRNSQLMKEYNVMKAKLALAEAKNEDTDLTKNQKIVSLSEKVSELTENFDNLDTKAGEKVVELQETIKKYSEGNAKLEKANGLLQTQLKEAKEKFVGLQTKLDEANDTILELKESVEASKKESSKKLSESIVASSINTDELKAVKDENENLKKIIASFKESKETVAEPAKLDMTKLDEAAANEIRTLKREVLTLKSRLGENVNNYVKTMENNIVSYYNDLEARYGESIKPYKASFLNARSLREAQRMFMTVASKLQDEGQMDESVYVAPQGKVSDFYQGNDEAVTDKASAFGLL